MPGREYQPVSVIPSGVEESLDISDCISGYAPTLTSFLSRARERKKASAQLHLSHFTFVVFVNTNVAHSKDRHLLGQPLEIFGELRVRMGVGRSRKWNSLFNRELNDAIGRIKFV